MVLRRNNQLRGRERERERERKKGRGREEEERNDRCLFDSDDGQSENLLLVAVQAKYLCMIGARDGILQAPNTKVLMKAIPNTSRSVSDNECHHF